MHLFKRNAVKDAAAVSAVIPIIDYGPYFAGDPGAAEGLVEQVRHACEGGGPRTGRRFPATSCSSSAGRTTFTRKVTGRRPAAQPPDDPRAPRR